MRIAYDAKRAFQNSSGLGNYSRSLILAMTRYRPEHQYVLYTPGKNQVAAASVLSHLPNVRVRTPHFPWLTSYWRSKGVVRDLKRDDIDLYHGLSHEIPIGIQDTRIKSVVTIHDLIFFRYPGFYPAIDRKIYETKVRNACKYADHIIAISRQTQDDLLHFLGIHPEKISVVYQDCNPLFYEPAEPEKPQQLQKELHLPDQFLLSVGTLEERKNVLVLLKALTLLPPAIKLVLVGKVTKYIDKLREFIAAHALNDRVIFLKDVRQDQLPLLYQSARVFLYPSRFEGFGIPVLEALNSGTPVIAATGSSLEEAGGPDSLYVHPDDEKAFAVAIQDLWTHDALREKIISLGHSYALRFREDIMAANIDAVYTKIIKGA